jgi:ribosomal protein L25 (general stress protein Ctc)
MRIEAVVQNIQRTIISNAIRRSGKSAASIWGRRVELQTARIHHKDTKDTKKQAA